MQNKPDAPPLHQEAEALAVAALTERLAMSYEERIEAHENARLLMEDLKLAGEKNRAESQNTP